MEKIKGLNANKRAEKTEEETKFPNFNQVGRWFNQAAAVLVSRGVNKDEVEECRLVFRLGLHL